MVALLTTSVQLKDCASAEHLCSLPAAQDTSSDIVRGLLATAVRLRCPGLARTLCALPATAQVSSAAYTNLMTAAVEQGATLVLFELARCRAGQLLTAACAAEILNVALGAGPLNDSILNALCDYLPAAAAIDRDSMSSLLLRAIREPHSVIVQRLCVLHPAVGQLTADDIIYLLRTALEQRVPSCVPHICQLPAAQFIPPSSLFSIMERGLQCNKAGGVLQIFNGLPMVVQQLNADQVAKLLNSSMQAGMPALHVVRSLTALPVSDGGILLHEIAPKLCAQHTAACPQCFYIHSNRYRPDLPQRRLGYYLLACLSHNTGSFSVNASLSQLASLLKSASTYVIVQLILCDLCGPCCSESADLSVLYRPPSRSHQTR